MRLLIDSRRSNIFNESNEELDEVLEENLVPSTLNVNEEPGEPLCVVCHNPTSAMYRLPWMHLPLCFTSFAPMYNPVCPYVLTPLPLSLDTFALLHFFVIF